MSTFRIPAYSRLDKRFEISGPLDLYVDNDDVPSDQVAILAEHVVAILNRHWRPVMAWFCENEDCEDYFTAVRPRDTAYGRCKGCDTLLKVQEISL